MSALTKRLVLFAIAAALQQGNREAGFRALRRFDPVLRVRARTRLRRVLHLASRSTMVDDPAHQLRLAYLLCARGSAEADFDDRAGIEAEQLELARGLRVPRSGPWLSVTAALLLGLAVTVPLGVRYWMRPFDPLEDRAASILGRELPAFLLATNRAETAEAEAHYREATGGRAEKALGADPSRALGELLRAVRAVNADPQGVDRLLGASSSLSRALATRGLPYFVDADVLENEKRRVPLVTSYYVERETEAKVGSTAVKALHVWRLDSLRVGFGAIGYARPRTPAALVLLDELETDLVVYVLPALGQNQPVSLVDLSTELRDEAWSRDLCLRAGSFVRRSVRGLVQDEQKLAEVGELLARRRSLVGKWQRNLRASGIELRVPRRFIPEADYVAELEHRVAREDLRAWQAIHADLLEPTRYRVFLELRQAYAETVERHELQHRYDFGRGLIPVPDCLCRLLDIDSPLGAPEGSLGARARDELSAYLASLADGPTPPGLALVLLSQQLFDAEVPFGPYRVAARAILEGLAEEVGTRVEDVLGQGRHRREDYARLLFALTAQPDLRLRAAARAVYQKAFGLALPMVTKQRVTTHPTWRH